MGRIEEGGDGDRRFWLFCACFWYEWFLFSACSQKTWLSPNLARLEGNVQDGIYIHLHPPMYIVRVEMDAHPSSHSLSNARVSRQARTHAVARWVCAGRSAKQRDECERGLNRRAILLGFNGGCVSETFPGIVLSNPTPSVRCQLDLGLRHVPRSDRI